MTVGPRNADAYPFAALHDAAEMVRASGISLIDFGMADPKDATPAFIRQAVVDAIHPVSQYPRAAGLPELRLAIAEWNQRRFDVTLDPDTAVLPTLGSKETIHDLVAYCLSPERNIVMLPVPAYPVYERGARFHGADVTLLPLTAQNAYLPDLDTIEPETWKRVALFWINYPHNPTGFTAPLSFLREVTELANEHGFVVASDEAYSEVYFDVAPHSILEVGQDNVVVLNTLSKRSSMTGYRSGFIAGDTEVISRIRAYRPTVGVTPQEFIQRASVAAWQDEAHVDQMRSHLRSKRDVIEAVLNRHGINFAGTATFFLWARLPDGENSTAFAEKLLSGGIIVSPGLMFGPEGEGYARFALVPTLEECETAAHRLDDLL